ncbi:hypothetical protein MOA93_14750 [Bacillus spizizenii]|uniref:hypothetical protein n=1 Tax=Bacillus inaquosorum TaxID=483913 RepID=UPI00228137BE|nr:hypothetical protein [Bacillus inaquosorum]MCY7886350.1 hypothetical protein [Bacillus spizizenii]MCY8138404.1 hypothetical protein [Bacillus inaquosorum]
MKLLLIRAKGHVDKEVKRSIENDVRQAINQGFYVYGDDIDVSVADVDASEITQGKETLWVDGRRMEASDFNGDIDEKDWGKDYDNH